MARNQGGGQQGQQNQPGQQNQVMNLTLEYAPEELASWQSTVSDQAFESLSLTQRNDNQKLDSLFSASKPAIQAFPVAARRFRGLIGAKAVTNGLLTEIDLDRLQEVFNKVSDRIKTKVKEDEKTQAAEQERRKQPKTARPEDSNPYKRDEVHSMDKFLADVADDAWEETCRVRLLDFLGELTEEERTRWAQTLAKPGDHRDKFAMIVRQPDTATSKTAAQSQKWI